MAGPNVENLLAPVVIRRIEIFRDGGTTGIELEGSSGRRFLCAVDGSVCRSTRDRIYTGAFYPGQESTLIQRGSPAETRILDALQEIMGRDFTQAEQEELVGAYGRKKLNEEERKAALCLQAIRRVRSGWFV
jgi:hypothetical protein